METYYLELHQKHPANQAQPQLNILLTETEYSTLVQFIDLMVDIIGPSGLSQLENLPQYFLIHTHVQKMRSEAEGIDCSVLALLLLFLQRCIYRVSKSQQEIAAKTSQQMSDT